MYARSAAIAGWVAAGLALCAPVAIAAPITFAFPAIGTPTPFSRHAGGLTAKFRSSNDPGGFFVAPSTFRTLSGKVLFDSGLGSDAFAQLDIAFSAPVDSVSFRFALDVKGPGTLDLEAFDGGHLVGSTSALGTVPKNDVLAQGLMSFGGAAFDSILLFDRRDPGFAIGKVTVNTTPIPEPTGLAVLGIGFAGLLFAGRAPGRRRQG
jgi:hypothetical protein